MTDQQPKQRYILTREQGRKVVMVSNGDHRGIKWWAKQRNITLTAALHECIVGFLGPKLIEVQQEAIFNAIQDGKLPKKAADDAFRRLLNIPKGLGKGRRPPRRRRRLPPSEQGT